MLKNIAILLAFLVGLLGDRSEQARHTQAKAQSTNPTAQASLVVPQKPYTQTVKDEHQNDVPYDVRVVSSPGKDRLDIAAFAISCVVAAVGVGGIFVAIATLRKIERQTNATEKSAAAALAQADHIVTSERAWIVANIVDLRIAPEVKGSSGMRWTGFSVQFVNKGETPAFLIKAACAGSVLPHSKALPSEPGPFDEAGLFEWGDEGIPLQPGELIHRRLLGTWSPDPVRINTGHDVLWVYGYVCYCDFFGKLRETRFCRRWVPGIRDIQNDGFCIDGPPGYNKAT